MSDVTQNGSAVESSMPKKPARVRRWGIGVAALVVAAVVAGALIYVQSFGNRSEVIWKRDGSLAGKIEEKKVVTFTNSMTLTLAPNPDGFGASMSIAAPGQDPKHIQDDDHLFLRATYPSSGPAEIAVVSWSCGGNSSECASDNVAVFFADGEHVAGTLIGIDPERVEIVTDMDGKKTIFGRGVAFGIDALGSPRSHDVQLVPKVGFVDVDADKKYLPFVGKHASEIFSDQAMLEAIAKAVGNNTSVRQLRKVIAVAGNMFLIDGRYLVSSGCKKHACPLAKGLIMVDTVTHDIYWSYVDDDESIKASGQRVKEHEIEQFDAMMWRTFRSRSNGGYEPSVTSTGELTFTSIK